ncbi:hypothetical protein TeGR_g9276, partial [Tetraparma gracilis]
MNSVADSLAEDEASTRPVDDDVRLPTYCAVNLRNIWRMAIVEIGVCYHDKGEEVPDGWETLATSVSGEFSGNVNAGLSYNTSIVFKRRGSTGRPDHITDIMLIYKSMSKIPAGYELVTKTVSQRRDGRGFDANLNRGTYSSLYICYSRNS